MKYEDCEKYILNIPRFTAKNDLKAVKRALEVLMDLSSLPKIIHVAGTNGKGSVCAFIKSAIIQSGLRVGTFTSPHLVRMTERISVNDRDVDENEFVEAFECVRDIPEEVIKPTFFEFLFLMAMVIFSKADLDYIILETGLGGRLDATNCLDNTEVCVITQIGKDHVRYLGDTYAEIASEKAGIIKKNSKVVFFDKREESTRVIEQRCKDLQTQYRIVRKADIFDEETCFADENSGKPGLAFKIRYDGNETQQLVVASVAEYQTENALLAFNALDMLDDKRITRENILDGIRSMYWPGRMEELCKNVYLDGAHNEDGIDAMIECALKMKKPMTLLFAVVNDKDYNSMIDKIVDCGCFDRIVITKAGEDRATDVKLIAGLFESRLEKYGVLSDKVTVNAKDDVTDAFEQCRKDTDNRILMVSGSLYLVGEIKKYFGAEPY